MLLIRRGNSRTGNAVITSSPEHSAGIRQKGRSRSRKIPAGPKTASPSALLLDPSLCRLRTPAQRISQTRFNGDNQAKVILAYFPCLELKGHHHHSKKEREGGREREKRERNGGRKRKREREREREGENRRRRQQPNLHDRMFKVSFKRPEQEDGSEHLGAKQAPRVRKKRAGRVFQRGRYLGSDLFRVRLICFAGLSPGLPPPTSGRFSFLFFLRLCVRHRGAKTASRGAGQQTNGNQ